MTRDGTTLATILVLGALALTPFCSSSGGGRYDIHEAAVEHELPPPSAFDISPKAVQEEPAEEPKVH